MNRIAGIALFVILLAQGLPAQDLGTDNALIRARYLLNVSDFEAALQTLEQVRPDPVTSNRYALTFGMALIGLGELPAAEQWLLQVGGDLSAEAFYRLAMAYALDGHVEKATEYLAKHLASERRLPEVKIKTNPTFAGIEESRAWIRLWQKDWYSDFDNQIREAEYLLSKGDQDGATELTRQLLASNPASADALFLQARVEHAQGRRKQMEQSLDRSVQLGANRTDLLERILDFSMSIKDYDRVNSLANRLLRLDPSNPDYLFSRALGRIAEGRESMVAREMEAISSIGIAPAELYYQAALRLTGSTPGRAELYLDQAIETGILDARYYYLRGSARNAQGKYDKALEDMAMSLDINPNQPDLYFDRAEIRLFLGDTEGACHDWHKALAQGHRQAPDRIYKYCR